MAQILVRGVLLDACVGEDGAYYGEHLQDLDGDAVIHVMPPDEIVRAGLEEFRNATVDVYGHVDLYEGQPTVHLTHITLVLPAQKPALA